MPFRTQNNKKLLIKQKNIEDFIGFLLDDEEINEGAKKFLRSLQKYYIENNGLTKKQYNALNEIHLTSLERKTKEHRKWIDKYNSEKRKIAEICARYYEANPPYFAYLSKQILNNSEFIPTKTQFKSMCENKFTKKVLKAAFSKPVFGDGELVQIRKNAPIELKSQHAVVVNSNVATIINAAKGAKTYVLLPFGAKDFFECEERYLKKAKKS